jgi:hypothetical protein
MQVFKSSLFILTKGVISQVDGVDTQSFNPFLKEWK